MKDAAHNLPETNKSLGQHWLTDLMALNAIVDAAQLEPDDVVLEIGPGLGTLTELLVDEAEQVIAVEFDAKLARELPRRVPTANLEVVQQDILSFDFTALPKGYKIVANIPYYLTSNLIRVISESANPPQTAVLLVQKEVAERVAAKPGQLSILGVTAQFYWQVSLADIVPANLFTPPPKVDSQILVLERWPKPLFGDVDPKGYFKLVKAGFSQKRKTLLNSLSASLQMDRAATTAMLDAAGINPTSRAQTLSLEQWQALYAEYLTR